jgi:hypothetical protein
MWLPTFYLKVRQFPWLVQMDAGQAAVHPAVGLSSSIPSLRGLPRVLVTGHPMEVCSLSCEVMLPTGATSIRPITGRPSLFPSSFTRRPISLSCDSLSQKEDDGLNTFRVCTNEWGRSRLFAGGTSSAVEDFEAPTPDHLPFWPKPVSTFGLAALTTFSSDSHLLTVPFNPSSRPP